MEPVGETLCAERQKVQDERFARDKERIENLEKMCGELQQLSTQMGELLKKYDEQLSEQDERIKAIEQKPAKRWDSVVTTIFTNLASALTGALIAILIK